MEKKQTININFPFIANVNDYHQFDDLRLILNELIGAKVKFYEITKTPSCGCYGFEECSECTCFTYSAIFYTGRRPKKADWEILEVKNFDMLY